MNIDKKIVKKLVQNLDNEKKRIDEVINEYIKDIKNAKTVEEIMEYKKGLLLDLLSCLPLNYTHCYFCLKHLKDMIWCENCEYAKVHGRCDEEDSDYNKIDTIVGNLFNAIEDLYYIGEKYDRQSMSEMRVVE